MPGLGEIKKANELGYKDKTGKCIWAACIACGKQRWVPLRNGKPRWARCFKCGCLAGTGKWHRGKQATQGNGYLYSKLQSDDFFYSMADSRGRVADHRLIMAKHLGRCLHLWEVVHHKNHIRNDNRIENLQLLSDIGHKQITFLEVRIKQLEKRIIKQANLIKDLSRQLKKMVGLFNKRKVY